MVDKSQDTQFTCTCTPDSRVSNHAINATTGVSHNWGQRALSLAYVDTQYEAFQRCRRQFSLLSLDFCFWRLLCFILVLFGKKAILTKSIITFSSLNTITLCHQGLSFFSFMQNSYNSNNVGINFHYSEYFNFSFSV